MVVQIRMSTLLVQSQITMGNSRSKNYEEREAVLTEVAARLEECQSNGDKYEIEAEVMSPVLSAYCVVKSALRTLRCEVVARMVARCLCIAALVAVPERSCAIWTCMHRPSDTADTELMQTVDRFIAVARNCTEKFHLLKVCCLDCARGAQ